MEESALHESPTAHELMQDELCLIKSIAAASTDAIAVVRPDGSIAYVNLSFEKTFGSSFEEASALKIVDFLVDQSSEVLNREILPLLDSELSWEGDLKVQCSDGRAAVLMAHISSIPGLRGTMLFRFSSEKMGPGSRHGDEDPLSSRAQMEYALDDSERKFRGIVEYSRDGIILTDEQGRIAEWNRGAELITGLNREQTLGRFLWDVQFNSTDRESKMHIGYEQIKAATIDFLRTGRSPLLHHLNERTIKRLDGSCLTVEEMPFIIPTDKGFMLCSTLRDVTERKKAQEAVRVSEEMHRAVIENIRDIIYSISPDGKVIFVSPNVSSIGYSPEEVIGHHLVEFVHPDDLELVLRDMERAEQTDESFPTAFRLITKDGSCIYVEEVGRSVKREGKAVMITGTIRDVTKRKRTEEALEAISNILRIANNETELSPLLDESIAYIMDISRCSSVGIRILDEEGNIPHHAYRGFSQSFYEKESPLSIKSDQCMCINVIKGLADPSLPFYSQGGSFYMNGTTRFLKTVSEEPKGATRNECNRAGYESVALIPIRFKGKITGLIHLADPRENMVPLSLVETLEGVAMQLGTAIARVQAQQALKDRERELRAAQIDLEKRVQKRTSELTKANQELQKEVSERILAEEALKESERRLVDTIDFLPDATFVTDNEGRVIAWNHAIEGMTGIKAHDILGKGDYEYAIPFHGDRRPILIDLVRRSDIDIEKVYSNVKRQDGMIVGEICIQNHRGSQVWLWGKAATLYDCHGKAVGAIESIRDITEHKRTEDELRSSEAKNRSLLDALPDAIFLLKGDGTFLDYRAEESDLYVPPEEFIGRNVQDVMPKDLAEQVMHSMSLAHETGKLQVFEYQLPMPVGLIDYEARIAVSGDDRFLVLTRNITERKRYEEALLQAKDAAEAAVRAKSEFLATMSHEIRTPMNAVIGMTSLLLEEGLTKEQRECVETIRASGDALLAVINDILDLSKIEKDRTQLELMPFDLHECLKSSMDMVAVAASSKGLSMDCSVDESVPGTISGDENRLRQVLVNLLGNAVKFTEKGHIRLRVEAKRTQDEGYEIHFVVEDTGIGIPKGSLSKLFIPFSQADMSTTRKYGGTGLGLAISKRLVELMGGAIWAESSPSEGSRFHFTIRASAAEMAEHWKAHEHPDVRSSPGDAMRILLAEDAPVNQKMAMLMLRRLGYRADAVANGQEVLEALKRQHYDVVLMDVQMPEMDGLEATRAIRKQWPEDEQPRIIAITAYAMSGDKERCIKAGMEGYIAKPIKIEDLKSALEEIGRSPKGSLSPR